MPADSSLIAAEKPGNSTISFRTVSEADAATMCQLAVGTGVLEANSCYCYLLLCRDFADTCVVACRDDELVGFVTAYRPPRRQDTVFVWQIGVAESARRQGIAKRLLQALLALPACRDVQFLEATVAPSNLASRGLFEAIAGDLGTACRYRQGFTRDMFGTADHEEEQLLRIGPLVK